jgi:hypothetical protein
VASTASTVIVVARVVVVVAINALRSSPEFYGIPGVAVGSETTLDRRCCGRDPTFVSLLLRRRWVRAMDEWRYGSSALQALSRGGAFCLLRRCGLE